MAPKVQIPGPNQNLNQTDAGVITSLSLWLSPVVGLHVPVIFSSSAVPSKKT